MGIDSGCCGGQAAEDLAVHAMPAAVETGRSKSESTSELTEASRAAGTGRVAAARVREINKPVVKLPARILDDHPKKLFADRWFAKMGRISGAVLKRVAQEYLADDRTKSGIFLASNTRL